MKKFFVKNYPHGFNPGHEYHNGKCPSVMENFARYVTVIVEYDELEILNETNPNQMEMEF